MTKTKMISMVQVGASRGLDDPYLAPARSRGLHTVLVETPAHLAFREARGGPRFDHQIVVDHPADPERVVQALGASGIEPVVILAGFERYVPSSMAASARFGLPRRGRGGADAGPPFDKAAQRRALTSRAPQVRQPRHLIIHLRADEDPAETWGLSLPAVVKATTGGGGLGVYRAESPAEVTAALDRIATLTNYDGSPFAFALIEEQVRGEELSVQGIARDGVPDLLTCCTKLITTEPDPAHPDLSGFRERAFLATPGAPADVGRMVSACLEAFGYRDGPFHVDLIRRGGELFFLEAGFRLSGGGVPRIVLRSTGRAWADEVLSWLLDERAPTAALPAKTCFSGQILLATADEHRRALSLAASGAAVEVQSFTPLPELSSVMVNDPGVAADLARHTGFVGRAVVTAATAEEVRGLLACCCPTLAWKGGAVCVG